MAEGLQAVRVELTGHEWAALATWIARDGDGVGLDAAVMRDMDDGTVRMTMLRADLCALARFVSGQLPSPKAFGWDVLRVGRLARARDKILAASSAL